MDLNAPNPDESQPPESSPADDEPEGPVSSLNSNSSSSIEKNFEQGQITVSINLQDRAASKDLAITEPLDKWLIQQLIGIIKILEFDQVSLEFVVVDDELMSSLHERYLDDATTTDVLTFDLLEEVPMETDSALILDGEIYACLDQAKREAKQRKHPWHEELLLYCLHGILHLMGYDDHDEADYAKMHEMEDKVLSELGIGPIFQTDQDGSK